MTTKRFRQLGEWTITPGVEIRLFVQADGDFHLVAETPDGTVDIARIPAETGGEIAGAIAECLGPERGD